jgi:hypothetical protein
MSSLWVVEDLQVFEYCGGQFDPGAPPLAVQRFGLPASLEGRNDSIIEAVTNRPHR